jgi:hypothetical protein
MNVIAILDVWLRVKNLASSATSWFSSTDKLKIDSHSNIIDV